MEKEKASAQGLIKAKIQIEGHYQDGIYEGNTTVELMKNRCCGLLPLYYLEPNGLGKFTSDQVEYEGKFFKGKFHDQTGNA